MGYIEFDRNTVSGYLDQLTAESKPQWGVLTAQGMIEHLTFPIKVAIGELEKDLVTPEDKLERSKAWLMTEKPMPVEYDAPFITDEEKKLINDSIDSAKAYLLDYVDRFYAYFETHPDAQHSHPNFGMLNRDEWIWLNRKHCSHHFKQFGLLDY